MVNLRYLNTGGAAGFTFQGKVGFVSSCDLWSYQPCEALHSREIKLTASLNLLNYTMHCLPSLSFLHPR